MICPCGCGATISAQDAAKERWLLSLVGEMPQRPKGVRVTPIESRRKQAAEPMTTGRCRCGSSMQLETFLAEFLQRNFAKWPACEACERKARAA